MLRTLLALPLLITACQGDETTSAYADPTAIYQLKEIDGKPFNATATLQFPEPGRITGEAPCNRFSGAQPLPYPWFKADAIAMTKRACPDLAQESLFVSTLSQMTLVEVSGATLILSTEGGRQMVFVAQE